MRYELQPSNRALGSPAPATDHNRLSLAVNALQQQATNTSQEAFVARYNGTTTWTVTNGTSANSSGALVLSQSGSSLVSASLPQAATVGLLYGVRVMVAGDATSSGKFVQLGLSNGSGYTQLSQPVKLTQVPQEVMAIVTAAGTSLTLSLAGFDTVSGNNITLSSAEVVTIQAPTTSVARRTVLKNGIAKRWRGMNHSNIPIGYDYNRYFWQEPKQSRYDLIDIVAGGWDCIKIYDDSYDRQGYGAFLDECYRLGIDVFMFHYTPQLTDYSVATGGTNRTAQTNAYTSMVTNTKYHPAVVGYGLGNEMNFSFALGTTPLADWYSLLDAATVAAKAIDSSRVYTTSNGDIGTVQQYDSSVPNLDVWGATVYRATSFGSLQSNFLTWSSKPLMVTEFGYDRYNHNLVPSEGEDEAGQAIRDLSLTRELDAMACVCARFQFEWADEWWKEQMTGNTLSTHDHQGSQNYNDDRDQTYDEEWFGITDALNTGSAQPRVKKQGYFDLKAYHQSLTSTTTSISEMVAAALTAPGGFVMRDTNFVRYQVGLTNRGIWSIVPSFSFLPESATTPIFQVNDTSFIADGSNLVDTWKDISNYRHNATQYNPSNKPTYIASSLNGHGIFRFGGSGQFMDISNLVLGNNLTIFIVAANQRPSSTFNGAVDTLFSASPSGGADGGVMIATFNWYVSQTQRQLGADRSFGVAPSLYIDGSTSSMNLSQSAFKVLTYQQTGVNPHNFVRIGLCTDGQLNGQNDIAEIIVYQGVMTGTQRSAIESSLMTKYGV